MLHVGLVSSISLARYHDWDILTSANFHETLVFWFRRTRQKFTIAKHQPIHFYSNAGTNRCIWIIVLQDRRNFATLAKICTSWKIPSYHSSWPLISIIFIAIPTQFLKIYSIDTMCRKCSRYELAISYV